MRTVRISAGKYDVLHKRERESKFAGSELPDVRHAQEKTERRVCNMKRNKRWLSGLCAVVASLFLLTGCVGGGYEYLNGPSYGQEDAAQDWLQSSGAGETGQESGAEDKYWDGQENSAQDPGDLSGSYENDAEETDAFLNDVKPVGENENDPAGPGAELDEYGVYTSMEDVALYLYLYEDLPDNFLTKKEAQALGWEGGSLEPYAPGMCIGGDYFGNYEGNLPKVPGREYHECDIDTLGARSRGAKRIVYSNDGLIYYTDDHYETFTLLYGEE